MKIQVWGGSALGLQQEQGFLIPANDFKTGYPGYKLGIKHGALKRFDISSLRKVFFWNVQNGCRRILLS